MTNDSVAAARAAAFPINLLLRNTMTNQSPRTDNTTASAAATTDPPKPYEEFDARLKETRAAVQDDSTLMLHEQLVRDLESLRRGLRKPWETSSEDALLRYCIAVRAKSAMPATLFDDAQHAYMRQPDDYDVVLGDLIPEDFLATANEELAQTAYLGNTNATADEDWGVFLKMRKKMGQEGLAGLPTGLPKLDEKLGGLRGLTFVGADKGVGKTSLVLGIALAALKAREDLVVLVYSLDMSKTRIYERLFCLESGLDDRMLFGGVELSPQDRAVATDASRRLKEDLLPRLRVVERDFSFEERGPYDEEVPAKPVRKGLTSYGIQKECRNLMAATGASDVLIVIDRFQKMDPRGEIADSLARDHYRLDVLDQVRKASFLPERPHGFPIVVISEIRKDATKAGLDRDDLKGDGRMASDADVVMLMWPDKSAGSASGNVIPTVLRIDKGREGVVRGEMTLWFQHTCSRFHDAPPTGQNFHHGNKIQPSRAQSDPLAE